MPRRYGKVTRFVLLNLHLRDAYSVADLATKERKAVRQMRRELQSKRGQANVEIWQSYDAEPPRSG